MVTIVVAYGGAELTGANHETTDGGTWDKLHASQSPADETDFYYEGLQAISNKVSNSTGGIDVQLDIVVDLETTPRVIVAVIGVSTPKLVDTTVAKGVAYYIGVGAAGSDYHQYYIFGSGKDYPPRGGFVVIAIDPNIAAYRDVGGTPDLTLTEYFGLYADITASVKVENVVHDTLSYLPYGDGLLLTRGDAGSTEGVFQDFIDFDEGTDTNRRGYAIDTEGILIATGMFTIGESGTDTEFTDSAKTIVFPDGRVGTGFFGLRLNIEGTSTIISISLCTFISNGNETSGDSRASLIFVGTTGTCTINGCVFVNFGAPTLTTKPDITNNTFLNCETIDLGTSTITFTGNKIANPSTQGIIISSDAVDIDGCTFDLTGGTGTLDSLVIDTAGTYNLDAVNFYGANGSGLYDINNTSSGVVTVNITNSASPPTEGNSRNTGGGSLSIVTGTVTTELTVLDTQSPPVAISGARVLCWADNNDNYFYQASVTIISTGTTATVTHSTHGLATNDYVLIQGANEDEYNRAAQITVNDANEYEYTMNGDPASPATGTILATYVVFYGTTDGNGQISDGRAWSANQAITGWARKSTSSPFYKTGDFVGTIDNGVGLSITIQLQSDE